MSIIVVLDFESTGLLNGETDDPFKQPGIVEIGAIKYNPSNMVSFEYSQLIDPECHFEEKAQQITGIEPEDLYGKPTFGEVAVDFSIFMVGTSQLVTFNGDGFDVPLLSYNLRRYNWHNRFPWPPIHLDLMKISQPILNIPGKQGPKFPSLSELHNWCFQEDVPNHHRALDDVIATMNCFEFLIKEGHISI